MLVTIIIIDVPLLVAGSGCSDNQHIQLGSGHWKNILIQVLEKVMLHRVLSSLLAPNVCVFVAGALEGRMRRISGHCLTTSYRIS